MDLVVHNALRTILWSGIAIGFFVGSSFASTIFILAIYLTRH